MEQSGLHISLAAEKLGTFFGMPITNSFVTEIIVMVLVMVTVFFARRKIAMVPGKVQTAVESMFEISLQFFEQTFESRSLAVKFFPFLATIFIFIAACNLFDFLPIVGSVGIHHGGEFVPFLRPANTDLNMTLALAIVAVIAIEVIGIISIGFFRYSARFFTLKSPVAFVVGLIEFMSELSRFVSFSFRLFGNIFAGEVLLAIAGFFMPYFLPVPIMAFETFVGIIQAAVFAMLTLFFIKLAITDQHAAH